MKCDVTVSKSMTIPTDKKYSSIKPSVTIAIKDVNLEDINKIHDSLETIVSGLLIKNIKEDIELMDDVTMNFEKISVIDVDKAIDKATKEIIGDGIPF